MSKKKQSFGFIQGALANARRAVVDKSVMLRCKNWEFFLVTIKNQNVIASFPL